MSLPQRNLSTPGLALLAFIPSRAPQLFFFKYSKVFIEQLLQQTAFPLDNKLHEGRDCSCLILLEILSTGPQAGAGRKYAARLTRGLLISKGLSKATSVSLVPRDLVSLLAPARAAHGICGRCQLPMRGSRSRQLLLQWETKHPLSNTLGLRARIWGLQLGQKLRLPLLRIQTQTQKTKGKAEGVTIPTSVAEQPPTDSAVQGALGAGGPKLGD